MGKHPCSWIRRLNIVKVAKMTKQYSHLMQSLSESLNDFFVKTGNLILKFT